MIKTASYYREYQETVLPVLAEMQTRLNADYGGITAMFSIYTKYWRNRKPPVRSNPQKSMSWIIIS